MNDRGKDPIGQIEDGALTRRHFMQSVAALLPAVTLATTAHAAKRKDDHTARVATASPAVPSAGMIKNSDVAYGATTLPGGIRSRFVNNSNGLAMHVLEAGFEDKTRPWRPGRQTPNSQRKPRSRRVRLLR